jgi:hypothetical protein
MTQQLLDVDQHTALMSVYDGLGELLCHFGRGFLGVMLLFH